MNQRLPVGLYLGILLLTAWLAIGTLGFMGIEGWSLLDSLYMTVITISTVGFREVHSLSAGGRLFATFLIVGGLGTAIYTFTRLGQLVLEGELADILGRRRMKSDLGKMKDHYIVCGYGRIGKPVVEGLDRDGLPCCVVDRDPHLEGSMRERGYVYVLGEATDEEILKSAGLERASCLLALLPSDADNLYLAITAKSIHPEIVVIARALDERAEMKLKRGGADRVVSPNKVAAHRILHAAVKPTIVEFMELVTHRDYLALSMEEIRVTEGSHVSDRTIAEAEIRRRCGAIVVAVKKSTGEMNYNPDPSERIEPGDILVALGKGEHLEKLERACRGQG
jgi:voltage-gated potassium channel